MKNISRLVLLLSAIFIIGAILFLSKWEIPAPVMEVEKVISNDKFPK